MIPENEWIYGTLLRIPHPPYCWGENSPKDEYYVQFADPRYPPDWGLPYKMVQGEVNPDTIGQFTGLKDKNGKEIYEGDIVAIQFDLTSTKSKVEWLQEISGFIVKDVSILDDELAKRIVVIGNIHDNPELLEEK